MSETKGPEINWFAAAGSALGSVTAAVLVSTLGAAGTVIGAGLGTLIITVGGSVYGHYLKRAKTNFEQTADKVKRNHGSVKRLSEAQRHDTTPISVTKDPEHAVGAAHATEKTSPSFKQILRDISWKRVAWLAAGLFAVTMAIVVVFELATGRPVSSYTGGTSPASTGTSLTGVSDPVEENPQWTPEPRDAPATPEIDQPSATPEEDAPVERKEEPLPQEDIPPVPVEPEIPDVQPDQAPLQEDPAHPVEPGE